MAALAGPTGVRGTGAPGTAQQALTRNPIDADMQDIVLIASVPLSGESWTPLGEGEVLMLKDGQILDRNVIGGL